MNPIDLERAADALAGARRAFALTGAGISVESGIPDFRSANGIWAKYPPDEYASLDAFRRDPAKVWHMWRELGLGLRTANPNPGHLALANMEELGALRAVVTQNIDNLHQRAGSKKVIDYHGNAVRLHCLDCHRRRPLDTTELSNEEPPRCACGAILKPDVVLFGEMIPTYALYEAEALAQNADVVLIAGTSAQVYPAAGLPHTAKRHGAAIIECNIEKTDYTRDVTDIFLDGETGTTLPLLLSAIHASKNSQN